MLSLSYKEKSQNLTKAIDIAIAAIKDFPPENFAPSHIKQFIDTYLDAKYRVLNPEPQFANTKSLSYITNDIFIYFQEGTGAEVNAFWHNIKKAGLPYKRKNKMGKIFKRKCIKNQLEYDFVIDAMIPYQQEGLLDEADIAILNKFIEEFEKRKG